MLTIRFHAIIDVCSEAASNERSATQCLYEYMSCLHELPVHELHELHEV